jgi:hypothetical protein
MKDTAFAIAGALVCVIAGSCFALAQAPAGLAGANAPANGGARQRPPMSFFVTSVGLPGGANMHGLAGADAHCQDLARNATGDRTRVWRAYLSTQERPGEPAVNARDRIGKGPWYNAAGVMIAKNIDDLHSPHSNVSQSTSLNEFGQETPGASAAGSARSVMGIYADASLLDQARDSHRIPAGWPRLPTRSRPHLQ